MAAAAAAAAKDSRSAAATAPGGGARPVRGAAPVHSGPYHSRPSFTPSASVPSALPPAHLRVTAVARLTTRQPTRAAWPNNDANGAAAAAPAPPRTPRRRPVKAPRRAADRQSESDFIMIGIRQVSHLRRRAGNEPINTVGDAGRLVLFLSFFLIIITTIAH